MDHLFEAVDSGAVLAHQCITIVQESTCVVYIQESTRIYWGASLLNTKSRFER